MALIQATLTYTAHGIGSELAVPVGSTDDPRILRVLRETLLAEAEAEASMWRTVDPGVFAMKHGEYERLVRVLDVLLPGEAVRPDLRILKGNSRPGVREPDGSDDDP